jgi:hypothetical protein
VNAGRLLWKIEPEPEDCVKDRVIHRYDSWLDSEPFTSIHPVQRIFSFFNNTGANTVKGHQVRETARPVSAKRQAVISRIAIPERDDRCYANSTSMVSGWAFSDFGS